MNDLTQLLAAVDQGDPHAAEQLLPLVYDELRQLAAVRLAHERPGQTLQATALVHEAYLRLVGNPELTPRARRRNGRTADISLPLPRRPCGGFSSIGPEIGTGKNGAAACGASNLDAIEIALDTPAEDLLALDEPSKNWPSTTNSAPIWSN